MEGVGAAARHSSGRNERAGRQVFDVLREVVDDIEGHGCAEQEVELSRHMCNRVREEGVRYRGSRRWLYMRK